MYHTYVVVTVKRWLKSVYFYRSYRKIKIGVRLFGPPCRFCQYKVYADIRSGF